MKELAGKTAVITGAGGGIGRSIALALADEKSNVIVADIEPAAAQSVADELRERGVEAVGLGADVSKLEDVEALADAAYERFGSVELLFNNAGVNLRPFRASWDTSYADFQWLMNVNFWGVLNGHHVFVPRMRETVGEKHIVNTGSTSTLMSMPGNSAYTAAKWAITGFSLVAREELATQDIGVSVLTPGPVRTRITSSENRLRPADERSEVRGVKPWLDYVGESDNAALMASVLPTPDEDPDFTVYPNQYISPTNVGSYALTGIKENRRFILTHPAPVPTMLEHVRSIVEGGPTSLSLS